MTDLDESRGPLGAPGSCCSPKLKTRASNAAYAPTGALTSLQEGSSLVSTMYYNNRLQPCRISVKNTGSAPTSCADATTGNVMDMTYGFNYGAANNGNVQSIANNINTARSQTYTYDELNRVSTAKTQATSGTYSWGLQFAYDPWANLLSASVTQGSAYSFSVYADGSNRIHNTAGTFTYDAAGNLTSDPVNSSYTYNAEGELISAAGVTYTYDGDGSRVQKSSGKLYWYGNGIDPLAESDGSGNLTNEYIFLSGARIAMLQLSSSTVNYYVADHLGSSRIVTNASGTVLDDSDFYPFGGERSYSSSSGNNYKFTGKERDTESGLDDFAARFYTSNYGRFLSADDSKYIHLADPQTLNLYTYVANNPINAVDPTGHDPNCRSCNMPMEEWTGGTPASSETAQAEADYDAAIDYTRNCIQDLAQCQADEEEQAAQQQVQYKATILGRTVKVTITAASAEDAAAISGRLDAAIMDINAHAGDLSKDDVKTLRNIKSIDIREGNPDGVDLKTRQIRFNPKLVLAEGDTTAWLAASIGHEAQHVTQYQRGEVYTKENALRMEQDANAFMIRVGTIFGLTQDQIDFIKRDRHTAYDHPDH